MTSSRITRRRALQRLAATGFAVPFVFRRHAHAAPSETIYHASFGASGMAGADIGSLTASKHLKLVAVADDDYKGIDPRQAHGSAYGMVPAHRGYQRPVGEWNYQEVTIKGSTIRVELNGTRILDCDLSQVTEFMAKSPHPGKDRSSGHFGFAGHNDPVAFRNIQIKRLDQK